MTNTSKPSSDVNTINPPAVESVAQRGWELYQRDIKAAIEAGHYGDHLVLDVDSGGYEIDKDEVAVMLRASERFPNDRRLGLRIGYPAMGYLATSSRRSSPIRLVESLSKG